MYVIHLLLTNECTRDLKTGLKNQHLCTNAGVGKEDFLHLTKKKNFGKMAK
jgi:hypothetical protein